MSIPESHADAILNRLERILERLEQLEARIDKTEQVLHEMPGMAAAAINTLDELSAPLRMEGSIWPERLPALLSLLEQWTQPEVLDSLEHLSARKEQFLPWLNLLADLPGLLNAGINGLDESMAHFKNTGGIDIQERGRALLQVVLQATDPRTLHLLSELLMQRETLLMGVYALRDLPGILSMAVDSLDEFYRNYDLSGHDLDRLLQSLRHGILDVHTVSVVASAGEALARSEKDYQPASLFQMLKALGTPEFRNSMGFLLSFVRHFNHSLQASSLPHSN